MRKSIYSWILFFLLGPGWAFAQLPVPEPLYVDFDKSFYLAGEDMWYSVYFLAPGNKQSSIVYVELIAPNGRKVMEQMLRADHHSTQGDFALPPQLSQGYYLFRAYTKWNLNFSPAPIYETYVPVYEFADQAPATELEREPRLPQEAVAKGLSLRTRDTYAPRSTISVAIELDAFPGMQGRASMAINRLEYVDTLGAPGIAREDLRPDLRSFQLKAQPRFEPEQHIYKRFLVQNPVNEEPIASTFIAGYVRQTRQRIIGQTPNGIVRIRFDAFYDSSVVQLFDANPFVLEYSPVVSELPDTLPLPRPTLRRDQPPMTPQVQDYIAFYKKRFHLNKVFGSLTNMRARQPEATPAQLTPSFVFNVDDYIEFETTERFIRESVNVFKVKKYPQYILPSRLKTDSDRLNAVLLQLPKPEYYFKLYVPRARNRTIRRNPLLIVNDYLTYDADAVLDIDIDNLKTVQVFNDVSNLPLQFGPIGNNGVITFETRNGNTPEEIANTTNNLKVQGFHLPRQFQQPAHNGFQQGESRIPNLRPMIYWNPELVLAPGEASTVQFSASDVPGAYLIRVEGVLENGEPIYAEKVIRIAVDR